MKDCKKLVIAHSSSPLTFSLSKKRVKTTTNLKNKSGFNYSMDLDYKKSRENFKLLTQNLPQKSGYLLLLASNDSKHFKTIKLIKSSFNLKETFFENLTFSEMFTYYLELLQTNHYTSIQFVYAESN
jgi:hypothetical protein